MDAKIREEITPEKARIIYKTYERDLAILLAQRQV